MDGAHGKIMTEESELDKIAGADIGRAIGIVMREEMVEGHGEVRIVRALGLYDVCRDMISD